MDEVTRLALEQAWEDGYQAALNNESVIDDYDNYFQWIDNPFKKG